MANNISYLFKFTELCQIFESVSKSKRQAKSDPLNSFIADFKKKSSELRATNPNAITTFYPFLRLILPQLERERSPYGLKEHTLGKKLIKMLCLPNEGKEAKCLSNFRSSPINANVKDFADAVFWVLKSHFIGGKKLTVGDVNCYLDALAAKHSDNDPRGLEVKLNELFHNTSAAEQKWLVRIILKDLKLGIGQDRILKLYHPDAVDFYSSNNSLSKVCDILTDSNVRLNEIEVTIFTPFRPMLSQRCDIEQFNKVFSTGKKFYIENKFDGERFQLHMENGRFKYFSRNGFDYTDTYGSHFNTGLYTPLLKRVFSSSVKKIILDGEMMGWNTTTKSFGSKGMEFDVKHLKANSKHQPCFCVFDILLCNDVIVTNKSLRERLSLLDKLVTPIEGVIILSKRTEVDSKQDVVDAINVVVDKKEEGIVFKDIESFYKSNDRKGGWWKMKLEYFENVMSDLDVIVMGGYYGEGRNRQRVAGFLVGVAVPNSEAPDPTAYLSLAKIASGLSNEELSTIEENLGPHWKKLNKSDPIDYRLQWGKEKPDVWIEPNKSCVLTVRASELIKIHTSDFKTNYTLRFPRIMKIRLDKPYYDCLTTVELSALTSSSKTVEKLNKRHLELSDLTLPDRPRKTRKRFLNEDEEPVEELSRFLSERQFCVLTGNKDFSKNRVEVAIKENGGVVVKHEGPQTLCTIVGDDHPRVKSCQNQNSSCDLVKLEWLSKILDLGVFKPYEPKDMLHMSLGTKRRFLGQFDRYGDSFTVPADFDSLQYSMKVIEESGDYVRPTLYEVETIDKMLKQNNSLGAFRDTVAYFDKNENLDVQKLVFKFLGGNVSEALNKDVTLIVTNTRKDYFSETLKQTSNNVILVVNASYISSKYEEIKSLN